MSDGTTITITGGTTKIVIGGGEATFSTDGRVVFNCPSQATVTQKATEATDVVNDFVFDDNHWNSSDPSC